MTENPGLLVTIFAFLVALGLLVFVHEMGHYLVGRWFGVKAEKFSIGFGKEIAGWTDRRGTRWKVGLLPLGGYVQFAGDMDPSSQRSEQWLNLPPEERNATFQAKALWKRALIVFAGPAVNFLFAILVLGGLAYSQGKQVTPPVIDVFAEGSVAEAAGMKVGDRIVEVNGDRINYFEDIPNYVAHRPGEPIDIVAERGGQRVEFSFDIGVDVQRDRFGNEYRFGVLNIASTDVAFEPVGLLEAPVIGAQRTFSMVGMMVEGIGQIISGRRSVKELGGPLKIAQYSGAAFVGGVSVFLIFLAFISINLGFINLLPIPMLDGGHLMFYAIEAVRRKPASPRTMEWAFRSGLAFVLMLMLFVTFNDLASFGLFR